MFAFSPIVRLEAFVFKTIMRVSEALNNFLLRKRGTHNGKDLIDRILSFGTDLELQINVDIRGAEKIEVNRWTRDGFEFCNFRIPKNADTVPVWRDWWMRWPLGEFCEAIGSTGFNWRRRTSEFVTFDFDALTHKAGLTSDQLSAVKDAAFALPYVEVRRSSGGAGYHLYVMLDSIPCANHDEHARLAEAVLKKMSADAGFDFSSHVDVCGGNCWFYHTKATAENRGFELIKGATE
jgi:hypothetical protein